MGLTLVVFTSLNDAGLIEFYESNSASWVELATATYAFVRQYFPAGATIRRDDVAKSLISYIEVDESLKDFLNEKKLRQKYWIGYFADLIIDRTWDQISVIPTGDNDGQ